MLEDGTIAGAKSGIIALVPSNGQAGEILFKASAEGLIAAELRLYAK
jgi:hypothetical protein